MELQGKEKTAHPWYGVVLTSILNTYNNKNVHKPINSYGFIFGGKGIDNIKRS